MNPKASNISYAVNPYLLTVIFFEVTEDGAPNTSKPMTIAEVKKNIAGNERHIREISTTQHLADIHQQPNARQVEFTEKLNEALTEMSALKLSV